MDFENGKKELAYTITISNTYEANQHPQLIFVPGSH